MRHRTTPQSDFTLPPLHRFGSYQTYRTLIAPVAPLNNPISIPFLYSDGAGGFVRVQARDYPHPKYLGYIFFSPYLRYNKHVIFLYGEQDAEKIFNLHGAGV